MMELLFVVRFPFVRRFICLMLKDDSDYVFIVG